MVRNSLAIFFFSSLVVGGETENMWGAGLRRPGWLVADGKYIEWPLTCGWWRSKSSMGLARISAAPLNLLRRWIPWLDFGAREVYRFIWSHHDVLSSPGFSCFWCGADDVSPRLPSYTTWLKNCTFLEGLGESWDLGLGTWVGTWTNLSSSLLVAALPTSPPSPAEAHLRQEGRPWKVVRGGCDEEGRLWKTRIIILKL